MQVRFSAHRPVHPTMPAMAGPPVAALFGHRASTVFLVAFGVMFSVPLIAFLLYIFTLPSDRGGGGQF